MRIIEWLLKNRLLVLGITAALAVAGGVAWTRLPIDAFPDVTNTQVMILTKAPGLAAVDVEQRVSFPIEQEMRGLPRVLSVRSLSKAELSQVVVVFEDGAETYWTRQMVFERLAGAREHLPPGVEPELGPISTGLGEIFQYTLEGRGALPDGPADDPGLDPRAAAPADPRRERGEQLRRRGEAVPGPRPSGAAREVPAHGSTTSSEAIERSNGNAGGGVVVAGWEQTYLRGVGLLRDVPDIERIVLGAFDGSPVYLRDVADVVIGAEPRQGAVTRDGKGEAVAGMVIMLKGANAKDVVAGVKDAIDRAQDDAAEGRADQRLLRPHLAHRGLHRDRRRRAARGRDLRHPGPVPVRGRAPHGRGGPLLAAVHVPRDLHRHGLGRAHLEPHVASAASRSRSGWSWTPRSSWSRTCGGTSPRIPARSRHDVIAMAVREVARPVAFSVLVIAVILVPLYALQGIEGKMFAPLATTMLIALLVSLAVALTVVPVLSATLLKQEPEKEFRLVRRFHEGYLRLLRRAVAHPRRTLAISAAVLVGVGCARPAHRDRVHAPARRGLNRRSTSSGCRTRRSPGSVNVASYMEKRLREFPEVETVVSKTGRAEISEDPDGARSRRTCSSC